MSLQGNAAAIVVNAQKIAVSGLKRHGHTEIPDVFLNEGTGTMVGLQIAPEKPLSDGCFVGGKAHKGNIHSFLQNIRSDGFFQDDGKTVDRGKIPALESGIYNRRKIQLVPDSPFTISIFFMVGEMFQIISYPAENVSANIFKVFA